MRTSLSGQIPVVSEQMEPSLVVEIEFGDRSYDLATSRQWGPQDFSIVDWTLLAEKGHPIMLDSIGGGLLLARDIRQSGGNPSKLSEWSSSGVM